MLSTFPTRTMFTRSWNVTAAFPSTTLIPVYSYSPDAALSAEISCVHSKSGTCLHPVNNNLNLHTNLDSFDKPHPQSKGKDVVYFEWTSLKILVLSDFQLIQQVIWIPGILYAMFCHSMPQTGRCQRAALIYTGVRYTQLSSSRCIVTASTNMTQPAFCGQELQWYSLQFPNWLQEPWQPILPVLTQFSRHVTKAWSSTPWPCPWHVQIMFNTQLLQNLQKYTRWGFRAPIAPHYQNNANNWDWGRIEEEALTVCDQWSNVLLTADEGARFVLCVI